MITGDLKTDIVVLGLAFLLGGLTVSVIKKLINKIKGKSQEGTTTSTGSGEQGADNGNELNRIVERISGQVDARDAVSEALGASRSVRLPEHMTQGIPSHRDIIDYVNRTVGTIPEEGRNREQQDQFRTLQEAVNILHDQERRQRNRAARIGNPHIHTPETEFEAPMRSAAELMRQGVPEGHREVAKTIFGPMVQKKVKKKEAPKPRLNRFQAIRRAQKGKNV